MSAVLKFCVLWLVFLSFVTVPATATWGQEQTKLKPGRLSSELRRALVEGLTVKYKTALKEDHQLVRLPALFLKQGSRPSSFIDSADFTAEYSGYLKLKLKGDYQFSLVGNGEAELRINDVSVLSAAGKLSDAEPVTVNLVKGYNRFELTYRAGSDGPRQLRVYWQNESFLPEPIPPTLFFTNGSSNELVASRRMHQGRNLVLESNCLKCHTLPAGESEKKSALESELLSSDDAPDLRDAGNRLQPNWVFAWLNDPNKMRNDVSMPHFFGDDDRQQVADLAAYLQLQESDAEPHGNDNLKTSGDSEKGGEAFESLGCIGCHSFQAPTEEDEYNRVSLHYTSSKYQPGKLIDFLTNPRKHYRNSRMPEFRLKPSQASDLAAFIREEAKGMIEESPAGNPITGRQLFKTVGCINCHSHGSSEVARRPLKVNGEYMGCDQGESPGGWLPEFNWSDEERESIASYLKVENKQSTLRQIPAAEFARHNVNRMRCVTCHDYDDHQAELPYIIEEEGVVGLPPNRVPMLTLAGEKLLVNWSSKLVSGKLGYRVREHFRVQMPGFPERGEKIAEGLAAMHGFAPNENSNDPLKPKVAEMGKQVVAMETGLSCNRCHAIADQKPNAAFDAQSTNLIYAANRLRKEYYLRWMFDPLRIDKQTKMPKFSEDRKTTSLQSVLDGNAKDQFESVWEYLKSIRAR